MTPDNEAPTTPRNRIAPIDDDSIRLVMPMRERRDIGDELANHAAEMRRRRVWWTTASALLLVVAVVILFVFMPPNTNHIDADNEPPATTSSGSHYAPIGPISGSGYVAVKDTIINEIPLRLYHIVGGQASLSVGAPDRKNPDIIFICQAAGTRGDTGGILGSFVDKGELLSTGSTKAGYCSIIDGKMEIGIKRESSRLEEALNKQGYFFRQYPLVIASEVIDNKQPGDAPRRALCLLGNQKYVVMSLDAIKLNDFSAALYELKFTDALYLVGGDSYGWGRRRNGKLLTFGNPNEPVSPNDNFIVWTNK